MTHHTKTITLSTGVKVTVGARNSWSLIHARSVANSIIIAMGIESLMDLPRREQIQVSTYIDMLVDTEHIDGDLGFAWPEIGDDDKVIYAAYQAISHHLTPKDLMDWHGAILDVSYGPGEEELKPGVNEKN